MMIDNSGIDCESCLLPLLRLLLIGWDCFCGTPITFFIAEINTLITMDNSYSL